MSGTSQRDPHEFPLCSTIGIAEELSSVELWRELLILDGEVCERSRYEFDCWLSVGSNEEKRIE